MLVRPLEDLISAIAEISDTPYGLAAGIFARNLNKALAGASKLRMGSLHINETSSVA
jgi:succinate-semialdehyde dehydrogenase/glutarate-semialdehyde dehydrogenase